MVLGYWLALEGCASAFGAPAVAILSQAARCTPPPHPPSSSPSHARAPRPFNPIPRPPFTPTPPAVAVLPEASQPPVPHPARPIDPYSQVFASV